MSRMFRIGLIVLAAFSLGLAVDMAAATMPMREGRIEGCLLGEFLIPSDAEEVDASYDVAEFEDPRGLVPSWTVFDGKIIEFKIDRGHTGVRPRARFVTRLTEAPRIIGSCLPASLKLLPSVLAYKADERIRDIDPFLDISTPLSPREQAVGNYAIALIDRAIALEPSNCRFHVQRAFILDRGRLPLEASAQLAKTRNELKCPPIYERVERSNHPSTRLPVEEATEEEIQLHELTSRGVV